MTKINKTDQTLLVSSAICFLLIISRVLYTEQITFIFLIWNLFLAGIPYGISRLLETQKNLTKYKLITGVLFWLLFFPNSPYIITDFVHLSFNQTNLFWVDVSLIGAFALTGLMYGVHSLKIIRLLIQTKFNKSIAYTFFFSSIFLAGFGIYIGRVLRWNSWNIITNPLDLAHDVFIIFTSPISHFPVWVISLGFSLLIFLSFTLTFKINDYE